MLRRMAMGVMDIVEFAGETSAGYAGRDQVSIEVAAVRAFDRSSRIGFAEKDALHLPGFERLKNAMSFATIASRRWERSCGGSG